ncbi:MAG: hypothetical protein PUC36_06190 [Clostridiales bacterium]|nr:hypothetical protein [Clostridiales bacterium]
MGIHRELSRFVLSRGLWLCLFFQAGALALMFRAGQGGALAQRLYEYAEIFLSAGLTSFASGLIGSLLMEDMLRYYGE